MIDKSRKILFVINKGSGKKKTDHTALIQKYYESGNDVPEYFYMTNQNDGSSLREKIRSFSPHMVVAVGGDGTVTFVAGVLSGTGIPMGILPAGSANGMAKELNIPEDAHKALEILSENNVLPVDMIRINDRICLHLADIGLNARLVKYFSDGPVRGLLGYSIALVKALRRRQRITVNVYTLSGEVKRNALMVIIANASKYGTGATINPKGDIFDGVFEVVIVKYLKLYEIARMFLRFQRFNPKNIEVIGAKRVVIETRHRTHFQVDGEYLGKTSHVEAHIVPGEIMLALPSATTPKASAQQSDYSGKPDPAE